MDIPPLLEASLQSAANVRQLDTNLFSVFEAQSIGAPYDSKAEAYDRMVSSDRYLRLAWGAQRSTIVSFMEEAFSSGQGTILDLAAGTSVDAFRFYATTTRPTIVVDLSLEMLRRGRDRLVEELGRVPPNIVFMQADARQLPFMDNAIATLLCHGGFHLFPSLDRVVSEWRRVLHPEGGLFVTSLVRERRFGNLYLALLSRLGEVSTPMSAETFERKVRKGLGGRATGVEIEGNFAYLRA